MEKLKKFFKSKTVLVIIVLVIGLSAGSYFHDFYFDKCSDKYPLINPVFACYKNNTVDKKEYTKLKAGIQSYFDTEKTEGRVSSVAVYFRDLVGGPIFGINDREDFIPASLLKLPVALTLLRLSEEGFPEILSQKLKYSDDIVMDNNKAFPPEVSIQKNVPYTVDELIERMIKYSDNLALELLNAHLASIGAGKDLVAETFRDLGILDKEGLDASTMSAFGYASIFRALYNSSFLSKENSDKLLYYLSESTFNEGLRAGVPTEIKIAHKFGERELDSIPKDEKQLHDCGIIYYPDNPYLLCVMTRGKEMNDLKNVIGRISKEVYKEFNIRSKEN